jgi:Peptidase family M49
MSKPAFAVLLTALLAAVACNRNASKDDQKNVNPTNADIRQRLARYTGFDLTTNLQALSTRQRQMIPHLIKAAQVMDNLFWLQAYGDKMMLFQSAKDPQMLSLMRINYGPWDRLDNDHPFVNGVGPKPPGANFYPKDMTKKQFEAAIRADPKKEREFRGTYTRIERDRDGKLVAVPYHEAYKPLLDIAANELRQAAKLAEDAGFRRYLELRAAALLTDDYQASDFAWLDMKTNTMDMVVGPIETYEDRLFGYKAAYEAYILVKDKEWSGRLAHYAKLLPELQRGLPVPPEYKKETPGSDSDLNAYDAIYYAGDANAGAKTIAINLPNDEQVQLKKGTRRLQLKNTMRAKFEKIALPIGQELIAADQRKNLDFDAFFANTMFHEVAHGLGIKMTLNGKGTVREALKEYASALEEGKADVLGLYLITKLKEKGELANADLLNNYVTFLAGIFRSIRFGGSDAHGVANTVRFNYFAEKGAFERDASTCTYRVNFARMQDAVADLSGKILRLQGDGDYEGTAKFFAQYGKIGPTLQKDLDRLATKGIPVDIVFHQGADVLGLTE